MAAALGLVGLVLLLPGCPLSPEEDDGNAPPDTRPIERDTPEGAVGRLAQVWETKDFAGYEEILHTAFRFYILDTDAQDLPWLSGDFWGRTEELEFANNMFNADFSGDSPPVQSIDWDFNILSQRPTTDIDGEAVTEITTDAVIEVLTGPNDGWRSDTRFVFDVIPDPQIEGLFQIKRQAEVAKF